MKKRVLLSSLVGILLLSLTGCGSTETLVCTQTQEEDGATMDMKMEVVFKDNLASEFTMTTDMKFDEEYADYMDTAKESFEDEFSSYKENGMDVDIQTEGTTLTAIVGANFDELTDEEKENLGFDPEENTYESVRAELEDSGLTCE